MSSAPVLSVILNSRKALRWTIPLARAGSVIPANSTTIRLSPTFCTSGSSTPINFFLCEKNEWIYRLRADSGRGSRQKKAGAGRQKKSSPPLPLIRLEAGAQVASLRCPIFRWKQGGEYQPRTFPTTGRLTSLQSAIPNLEHPPQRQVRKKLEPPPVGNGWQAAAVLQLEWIAPGLTGVCFWIAPRSRPGGNRGAGRSAPRLWLLWPARWNPNRCLAGLRSRDSMARG